MGERGKKYRTQITFSRPLIYVARMMGCAFGRGEMWIIIPGWALVKVASMGESRNELCR